MLGVHDIEASVDNSVETGLISGPRDGPISKIVGNDLGIGVSLNSNRSDCSDLERINFSDVASMPTLMPPMGFTWEFIAGGWALRPCDGQSTIAGGWTDFGTH